MSSARAPSGHFLSLPPSFAQSSGSSISGTASHASQGFAPNVASLAAADFDVDVRTGFLPANVNLSRLPSDWDLWEDALSAARGENADDGLRLRGPRERDLLWRQGIQIMPVLPAPDASLPLLRRAHLVLSFLLHFYAHTTPTGPVTIPPSIAVPLVQVSNLLGLPPVVTYSDTVLYNFLPEQPSLPVSLSNIPTRCIETFTNTRSEEQFYVISARTEIAGAEALRVMRRSLDEMFLGDAVAIKRLTSYLRKLAAQIDLIGDITLSMIHEIDPEEFYHLIRPWFRGGDGDGPTSLGWAFEGVDASSDAESGKTSTRATLFSGPSAGQSSLIHAIDIFLTVDHAPRENETLTLDAQPIGSSQPNEATFVKRMLQYMPQQHRAFLLHLASQPTSLRQLVVAYSETQPKLVAAYDLALAALQRFREKHMRVVSIFIVQQARRQPSERIANIIGHVDAPVGELRGTGGSPLFKFLKRCRDNTTAAMIKPTGPSFDLS